MSSTFLSRQGTLCAIIFFVNLASPSFAQHLDSPAGKKFQEGARLIKKGKYSLAQKTFIHLINHYKKSSNEKMFKTCHWLLADAYIKDNNPPKALTTYIKLADRYLPGWRTPTKHIVSDTLQDKSFGDLFYNMSTLYYKQRNYLHAKQCGGLAITIYRNTKQSIKNAFAHDLIAEIYKRQADMERDKWKKHQQRLEAMRSTALACSNYRKGFSKGISQEKKNEYQKIYQTAFSSLKKMATTLNRDSPDSLCLFAKAYFELGKSAFNQSNKKEADAFFQQASDLYRQSKDWIGLSQMSFELGKLEEAYNAFMQVKKGNRLPHMLCNYAYHLGKALLEEGKTIEVYEKSLTLFTSTKGLSEDNVIEMHEWLAKVYFITEEYKLANDHYKSISDYHKKEFSADAKLSLEAEKIYKEIAYYGNIAQFKKLHTSACHAENNSLKAALNMYSRAKWLYECKEYNKATTQLNTAIEKTKKIAPNSDKTNPLLSACNSLLKKLKKGKQAEENFIQGARYAAQKKYQEAISCYTLAHKAYVDLKINSAVDDCLYSISNIHAAQKNQVKSIDSYTLLKNHRIKVYTKTHPKVAEAISLIAGCYHMMGDDLQKTISRSTDTSKSMKKITIQADIYFQKSIKYHTEAINIRKKVAPNSKSLAGNYANLASCLWKLDKLDLAITHYLSGIKICKKLKGSNPVDHLYMLTNLIYIYEETGQVDKALEQAREAWQFIKNPSPSDVELCITYIRLYKRKLHRIQSSKNASQTVQQLTSKKKNNPHTHHRKSALGNQGKTCNPALYIKEIIKWHEVILAIHEKANSQIGIAQVCHQLSIFFHQHHMFKEALPYIKRTYKLTSQASTRKESPTIANIVKADIAYCLGMNFYNLNQFKQSVTPLLDACQRYEKESINEVTHPSAISAYALLGLNFLKLEVFNCAINYYNKALEGQRSQLVKGRGHEIKLAQIHHDIAFSYSKNNQKKHSLQHYKEACKLQEKHLNKDTPSKKLADIYTSIGKHYFDEGRQAETDKNLHYASAKTQYQKALQLHKAIGQPTAHFLIAYLNLAKTEEMLGNRQKAAKLYEPALGLAKKIYTENDPRVGRLLNAIALNLFYLEKYMASLKYSKEANLIFTQSSSHLPLDVASTLYTLGLTCDKIAVVHCMDAKQQKYFDMSINFLNTTVKLRRQHLPKKNPLLGTALVALAASYRRTKQVGGYIKAYLEAIDIAQHNNDLTAYKQYILEIKGVCQQGIDYYTNLQKQALGRCKNAHVSTKINNIYTLYISRLKQYQTYDPAQNISTLHKTNTSAKANESTSLSEITTEECIASNELPTLPSMTVETNSIAGTSNLQA